MFKKKKKKTQKLERNYSLIKGKCRHLVGNVLGNNTSIKAILIYLCFSRWIKIIKLSFVDISAKVR